MDSTKTTTFEESHKKIRIIILIIGVLLLFLLFFVFELFECMFYTSIMQIMLTSFLVCIIYIAFTVVFIFEVGLLIKLIKPCRIEFLNNYMYATCLKKSIPITDITQIKAIPLKSLISTKNIEFCTKAAIMIKTFAGIGSQMESKSQINIDLLPHLSDRDHMGTIVIKDVQENVYFLPLDLGLSQYTIEDIRREIFH